MDKFNLIGYEIGCDSRCSPSYRRKVKLRETKTMFISECHRRYKKSDGYVHGSWPMFKLDLKTIEEIKP